MVSGLFILKLNILKIELIQSNRQGYMGNSIVKTCSARFQRLIKEFYEQGKKSSDKMTAAQLWINEKNVVVAKDELVLPGEHLMQSRYKDVIEREGPFEQKIRY